MKNIFSHLASLTLTSWVGSLWAIGYLAVPVLFYSQPDKQLAGMLAGHMFTGVGYIGIVCGLYLLVYFVSQSGRTVFLQSTFWLAISMILITLIIQFGIQPSMNELKTQALPLDVMHSAFYGRFKMLHGISSVAYMIESILGVFLVITHRKPEKRFFV